MLLTKYEHACLVLEIEGQKLVIDPGSFSDEFGRPKNICAVVITHIHADHFSPANIETILRNNPEARIFTTAGVADKLPSAPVVTVVHDGAEETVGPFYLRFIGDLHQLIHTSLPRPHNVGVLVNQSLFYPGDALTVPRDPIEILAVPGNAPWASVADSMDYIAAIKPDLCFPTHNGLLSENGHMVYNASLEHMCKTLDIGFRYIPVGESIDFS